MALTLAPQVSGSIGLDEFVETVERELQTDDVDALCALASPFARLLNNRRVITDVVDAELRAWRDLDLGSEYLSHTLVMIRRPRFLVRANIWGPPDAGRPAPRPEDPGYGYLIPHDHNFAFMTGGYYGPGYTTFLYEYDYDAIPGEVLDPVELRPLETTTLPQGKIMVYRPSQDVHYQELPREYSISLNLIVPGRYTERAQYLFDLESRTVSARIDGRGDYGISLCDLASHVGDDETAQLLADVAERADRPRIRAAAARSLDALRPARAPEPQPV